MFKVGQKVVCIDAIVSARNGETIPKVGSVYTVREFHGCDSIRLVEIVNTPRQYYNAFGECSFYTYKFKPLQEERGTATIEDFINVKQTNEITFYNWGIKWLVHI